MRIAYILDTYPSISETFIAREIAALRRRGFTIGVWALRAGEGAHLIPRPPWLRLLAQLEARRDHARPRYHRALGRALWQRAATRQALEGIEHIHAGWASHPAFIGWGLAEAAGCTWSFSGHARDLFVEGSELPTKMGAARFATACTCAGQTLLAGASSAAPGKAIYAPHGLEIARYPFVSRSSVYDTAPLQLLSVGRLIEKKGFDVLLEALAIMKAEGRDCVATIIGDGPLATPLREQAARLNVSDRLNLTGALPHEDVVTAMKSAGCLVLPSKTAADGDRDGLPNVLLEAAACGLPIVATTAGSVTDFLNAANSRLCPPEDPAALAAAISSLVAEPTVTDELAQAARAAVASDFDADVNIEILAQALLKQQPAPR